jgi:hypothetical protein
MLIAQEERAINHLEETIEKLQRARDRAIQQKESLKFTVSEYKSTIEDYSSGETIVTARGTEGAVENVIDPSAALAISNYDIKIQEAQQKIQRRRSKIETYEDIIERLAREELWQH